MKEKENTFKAVVWLEILLVLVALVGALIYFGKNIPKNISDNGSGGNILGQRKARTYSVFYKAGVFSPTNLRIKVGDTVKFQNSSLSSMKIISDTNQNGIIILPGLDSVTDIVPSSDFSYTFSQSGIFSYHNVKNDLERGTVIVKE